MDNKSNKRTNYHQFDININNFKNEDYIIKLSNQPNMKFFKDELTIKYSGKGYNTIDYATAQSNKPLNRLNPIFYFEVEIVEEGSKKDITIGFSDKEFVLNKQCGTTSKSYGLNADGKTYHDKQKEQFGGKFKQKDIVGCGYYFSKNSIFYTLNGKFVGWAFKDVEYFPYYATISLHSLNEKVTVNFGKKNFLFDIEGFYVKQMQEKIDRISHEQIELNSLEYIVREYLVHSGYQETFNSMEVDLMGSNKVDGETNGITKDADREIAREISGLSWKKDSLEFNHMMKDDDFPNDVDKIIRKYSADEGILYEPEVRKRTLSIFLERIGDENERPKDIFFIMNFLKERKIIHNMIIDHEYDTALSYFESSFSSYQTTNELTYKRIVTCLVILKYFHCLKTNDYITAYNILNRLDQSFWSEEISISLYDENNKVKDYTLEALSVLLCYSNITESEHSHFFMDSQKMIISDQINSRVLELAGLSSESILEKIFKQHQLVDILYRTIKNCHGEKIGVKYSQ